MDFKKITNYIQDRVDVFKISFKNTIQLELSSSFTFWDAIISTLAFTFMNVLFINILFERVKLVAGYSKDEMLFFMLIAQTCFYLMNEITNINVDNLWDDIKSGGLDLVLSKPLPSLFYVSIKNIRIINFVRVAIPTLIALSLTINWSNLSFNWENVIIGFMILILGQGVLNAWQFMICFINFKQTNAYGFRSLFDVFEDNLARSIPMEGINQYFRIIFLTLIPVLISSGLVVSVMLGKSDALLALLLAISVFTVGFILKTVLWSRGLKNYSSASS